MLPVGDCGSNFINSSFFASNRITSTSPFDSCASRVNLYILLSKKPPICLTQPVQELIVTLSAPRPGRNTNKIATICFVTATLRKYCHMFMSYPNNKVKLRFVDLIIAQDFYHINVLLWKPPKLCSNNAFPQRDARKVVLTGGKKCAILNRSMSKTDFLCPLGQGVWYKLLWLNGRAHHS